MAPDATANLVRGKDCFVSEQERLFLFKEAEKRWQTYLPFLVNLSKLLIGKSESVFDFAFVLSSVSIATSIRAASGHSKQVRTMR